MEKKMCGCGLRPKSKEEHNAELRQDAARIVAGVENYSGADKMKRAAEVKAAFPPVKAGGTAAKAAKVATKSVAKTTTKAAAKPAAKPATRKTTTKAAPKGPTPAGMSVGPHDGDLC